MTINFFFPLLFIYSCVECQSRYFDCEFDHNDNEKTDGGLGAGNGAINYGTAYCNNSNQNDNKLYFPT